MPLAWSANNADPSIYFIGEAVEETEAKVFLV
jgi:hypothetical protein